MPSRIIRRAVSRPSLFSYVISSKDILSRF
jgi:hypothetical protein